MASKFTQVKFPKILKFSQCFVATTICHEVSQIKPTQELKWYCFIMEISTKRPRFNIQSFFEQRIDPENSKSYPLKSKSIERNQTR